MQSAPATRREIPGATVARLPVYLRALRAAAAAGTDVISSEELARAAGVRSSGLRKDLSFLGSYGVRGVGYDVEHLTEEISRELGLHREWSVAIIGMGNLGHALAAYSGFATRGFSVRWLVDSDPAIIGRTIAGKTVIGFPQFEQFADDGVIAVLATPPASAQAVTDQVVALGIRSILNFAPVPVHVPDGVEVRKVDLATELQILAFHGQRAGVEA
ncbi:redox-sensing transcriptional repressor Rex [Branchiibius cervicis]|uniref:Redox-sensing transcriptional repressor Rex n=1 Tax=Branchiibius cervicis TaxID=908252 RepID=A0ABW2ANV9_9MICO